MVQPPIRYIFSIGEFCALFFGGSMILGREMQLGELIQFTTYVAMLYCLIQWLSKPAQSACTGKSKRRKGIRDT